MTREQETVPLFCLERPDYWIITIRNDAGAVLPSTGGPGTTIFMILGTILVLTAGILLRRRLCCS